MIGFRKYNITKWALFGMFLIALLDLVWDGTVTPCIIWGIVSIVTAFTAGNTLEGMKKNDKDS